MFKWYHHALLAKILWVHRRPGPLYPPLAAPKRNFAHAGDGLGYSWPVAFSLPTVKKSLLELLNFPSHLPKKRIMSSFGRNIVIYWYIINKKNYIIICIKNFRSLYWTLNFRLLRPANFVGMKHEHFFQRIWYNAKSLRVIVYSISHTVLI